MLDVLVAEPDQARRERLVDVLAGADGIAVAGTVDTAEDVFAQRHRLDPDVVVLGLAFEGVSGLDVLDQLMRREPVPVLIAAGDGEQARRDTVKAFSYGAVDVIVPAASAEEIVALVRVAGDSKIQRLVREHVAPAAGGGEGGHIVVVGSSTGGPGAVEHLLRRLPAEFPAPVVVAQHLHGGLTGLFAERLDGLSALDVRAASGRHGLAPGAAWIAPGDGHVDITQDGAGPAVAVAEAGRGPTPSINRLFTSAVDVYGDRTVAVVLSGMGRESAVGARFVKSAGGTVLVQDEASSVVWGLGRHVVEQGDADRVLPLAELPGAIMEAI